ncbi:MAG TPA: M23 family metallopeptidase [Candidatus Udaeobacter sp.]|nr:M23 family metallopeptidase [Candidatus Udaeobacter sp.]
MNSLILMGAVLALALVANGSPAEQERGRPTAILVSPIHEAQVVRADDGMDHVEYELLVVNAVDQPVTLTSLTVLNPSGKELTRIDGPALVATTQTLLDKKPLSEIPASSAAAVHVDLIVPPGTTPERVTHRLTYSVPVGTSTAVFVEPPVVDGFEVGIDRRPATVIKPPLKGNGWLATAACCTPNVHRDLRVVVNGRRIESPETFAVDWALLKGDRVYDGGGTSNEQFYDYGADVLAVAEGTVVSVQDGKPDATPNKVMTPKTSSDFGGNHVILEIAPNVFAAYAHLQPGSIQVKVGDNVKVGARLGKIGNTGPSLGPHLHFGLLNRPDLSIGRSLPFVIDNYTLAGAVDFKASQGDTVALTSNLKQVRSAYPLYGGIQNFP